jgi:NAD(P)-dependent dehydrogenase (short-subunit alcohol dehydrogenase family)
MNPERVLITGTTTGLGRQLLDMYVERGAKVISVNRRRAPELERQFPAVRFECADVRSPSAVARLLGELADADELPTVLILNAGINRTDNDESFELATYQDVLATNLFGVLSFVEPLTRLPAGVTARHVIAVSSMASYVGNPYGLGYFTSKRALTACFDVWSSMYAGTDLIFQQVMLGPVRTQMYTMAAEFPRWMVWLKDLFAGSVERSAEAIRRFAATRRAKLFYPRRSLVLYFGMWACRALVPGLFRGKKTLAGACRRCSDASR